jgi:hypothetical protein
MSAAPVFQSVMQRIINIDSEITKNKTNKKISNKKSDPILIQKNIKKSKNIEMVEMPNLYGKSVMEAYSILNKKGIKPQLKGNGVVIFQSIPAGDKIPKQSICILKAEMKS